MSVDVKCSDFLARNDHLYARKARRKKIALIRIDVTNGDALPVVVRLASASLTADGRTYHPEDATLIVRKFGEFTWDFLLYSLIDFHPVTAVLDMAVFLSGPLYKRRLRRQLKMLTNADLPVPPGASKTAVLAFRGVAQKPEKLTMFLGVNGDERTVEYSVDQPALPR
jgi:hypothetical protein